MANTAAMTLSSATCIAEQKVTATCTITNGGTAALYVTSVQPTVVPNSLTAQTNAIAIGQPAVGGAFNVTLPGSGTLALSWDLVPHTPTTTYGTSEASGVVTVGATIGLSDGSTVTASTTNLTVSSPALT